MNKSIALAALAAVTLTGCTLAPKYQRPAAPVAQTWPKDAAALSRGNQTNAVADIGWREFFRDPRLQQVIGLALTNNRDLRVAMLNVEQSRAQYRIERAALFPEIDATGSGLRQRLPHDLSGTGHAVTEGRYSVNLGTTAYELDLFGRIRSLKAAALENYFATEEARKSAQITLVAEVAVQYLAERELNEQLEMTRRTLAAVQDSYRLIKASYDVGNSSELDLRTAQAQVATAKGNAALYEQQRDQARHALVLLVGEPLPANLPRPQSLNAQRLLTDLPPGLPSDLLERRPDILAAEDQLKAANANIGAARAAFFPTIKITADAGVSSAQLSGLFADGSGAWLFNPQITLPIFAAGQNKANLDVATISKRIEVANYEKAIQTAFREVADALTAKRFLDEQVADGRALVQAEQSRYDLADARYRNGVDNYLTVLTAQQDLYSARQNLIATQFARLSNLISLYQALGGGWREFSPAR
ncbi:MAG TPA: AdeC/AdeK/OprM family multidrug efflux complex outer membrane factor [Acidocella sp.]|nr:AdeC/AdeK/OprM family multidrug efflux complex outer membrane factor [Acidocella sp.]